MNPLGTGFGLLCWGLSFSFSVLAALVLGRRLRTGRRSLDAAAVVFLWIWVVTLITFILGLAGQLHATSFGFVGALGLVALLGIHGTRRALEAEVQGWAGTKSRLGRVWTSLPGWMRGLTIGFAVLSGARFALLIWALPPFVWDSLTYHLTNVAEWIQDGRIHLFETAVQRTYSPANYEVLAAWFAVFLHHDVVIEAAGLASYALAGLSTYALARALKVSTVGSWAAALVFLSTPALVFAATGTKNDPFVAAIYLFLAALILHLRDALDGEGEVPVMSHLILAGLGITYAVGTKAYMAQLAVGLVVLAIVPGYRAGLRQQWSKARSDFVRELRSRPSADRLFLLGLVAAGLLLGGYWNARNWVLKGNPFYPYEVAYETQASPGTGSGHYGLGWARLEENLVSLASKFGDKRSRVLPDLPETTGWGWLVYGMGLAACAWACVYDRRYRFLALGFGVSAVLLMASNTTSPWNMRYFIWAPALFAVGIGVFMAPISTMDAPRRRALVVLFGFGLAMNFVMSVNYNLVSMKEIAEMLALPVGERDAGRFHLRTPIEYELAYTYVPPEARLGYNVHENGFVYPLFRADFSQVLVYVPLTADDTCEGIARKIESKGTRYLFVAPEHTEDGLLGRLRECASTPSPIRERAVGLYVVKRDGE